MSPINPPLLTEALLAEMRRLPVGSWVAVRKGAICADAPTRSQLHALVSTGTYDFELKVTDELTDLDSW